jgi:hypothetical protein
MEVKNTVATVSGNEVDGAIRLPGAVGNKKAPKLRKDGQPRKARKVTADEDFLKAYGEVLASGGTIQNLADKIGAEYGSVIQRIGSINEQLLEAKLPELPELKRASGPRKDKKKLLGLVGAMFPIGKGTLESLPVDAPIQQGPPAVTDEVEADAETDEVEASA